jgi:hypothetical protein
VDINAKNSRDDSALRPALAAGKPNEETIALLRSLNAPASPVRPAAANKTEPDSKPAAAQQR